MFAGFKAVGACGCRSLPEAKTSRNDRAGMTVLAKFHLNGLKGLSESPYPEMSISSFEPLKSSIQSGESPSSSWMVPPLELINSLMTNRWPEDFTPAQTRRKISSPTRTQEK